MTIPSYFPTHITSTDLVVATGTFSQTWKEDVTHLAERIVSEYKNSNKERFIVVLGGPSGSSKSTTASVLEVLISTTQPDVPVVVLGQDGYHYHQDYLVQTLDEHNEPLANHKGRYDSFDVTKMKQDVDAFLRDEMVSLPAYSRKIHNPVDNAVMVQEGPCILIFEGLWLLYDMYPWNELLPLYDFSIFIHTPPDARKENTIKRHIQGNEHSTEEALIFYEASDAKNGELIMAHITPHDFDFYYS